MSFKDRKFGLLTIRRQIAEDIFECDCACGNLLDVWRSLLTSGVQRDCGMCRRMMTYKSCNGKVVHTIKPTSLHGHTRSITRMKNGVRVQRFLFTREYATWAMAIQRCHDKKFMYYDRYGGKGIRVCQRWRERRGQGLRNFLDDMGPRPLGKTLDRINPRGHYEPGNCRWATPKVQCDNQTHKIWQHCAPPPVEKVREMERRIKEEYEEMNPY
jgi:hypothetical protein